MIPGDRKERGTEHDNGEGPDPDGIAGTPHAEVVVDEGGDADVRRDRQQLGPPCGNGKPRRVGDLMGAEQQSGSRGA